MHPHRTQKGQGRSLTFFYSCCRFPVSYPSNVCAVCLVYKAGGGVHSVPSYDEYMYIPPNSLNECGFQPKAGRIISTLSKLASGPQKLEVTSSGFVFENRFAENTGCFQWRNQDFPDGGVKHMNLLTRTYYLARILLKTV